MLGGMMVTGHDHHAAGRYDGRERRPSCGSQYDGRESRPSYEWYKTPLAVYVAWSVCIGLAHDLLGGHVAVEERRAKGLEIHIATAGPRSSLVLSGYS